MITHERLGFDEIGQEATQSFISVKVVDRSTGQAIPGAMVSVSASDGSHGGNTNGVGTTTIALPVTEAAKGSIDTIVQAPGYNGDMFSIPVTVDPSTPPTTVALNAAIPSATPIATAIPKPVVGPASLWRPTARAGVPTPIQYGAGPQAAFVAPESNLPLYLALGGVGLAAIIVVVLIARS